MKNKIFELYKPDSLAEFLTFHKNNPEEKFVYVAQQPPANINILSASDFGYLVICLPNTGPESQAIYSDRKSTRLNSSHGYISYAVFCLKKKK